MIARGARPPAREVTVQVATGLAALGFGALFALSAFAVGPFALPAVTLLAALTLVTLARPEIGLAAAFAMVALGNLGLTGRPPWVLAAAWTGFLVLIATWRLAAGGERLPRLAWPLAVYLGAAVLAFLLTADQATALPAIRTLVTGLGLFFAIAVLVRDRDQALWVVRGTSAAAIMIGGLAAFEVATGRTSEIGFFSGGGEIVSRATAGFSQPNQLGGFLVILVPPAIAGAILDRRWRIVHAAAIGLAVVGVYASFSRGALLGLAVIPFAFLRPRHALTLLPLAAVVALLATPGLVRERFTSLTEQGGEIATRVDFWRTAESIWAEHPLLGVGLGGFPDAYAQARVPDKRFLPSTAFQPPPHAHNVFLQHLAEQGIVGLLALLAVLWAAFACARRLRAHPDRDLRLLGGAFVAMLVAFLVHNQFDVTQLEATGILFWGLLGLLSAVTAIAAGRTRGEHG